MSGLGIDVSVIGGVGCFGIGYFGVGYGYLFGYLVVV